MPKDPVVQAGDPVLRQKAGALSKKDITSRKVQVLLKRMSAVLKKEGFGVAIAAPQIGVPLQIFVVAGKVFDTSEGRTEALPDKVFINPELTKVSKAKSEMTEGCLSVRNRYGAVLRHEKASVKALNERGEAFVYHGSGLVGQIFQHEVDHLNGILYVDKAIEVVDDADWKKLRESRRTVGTPTKASGKRV